MTDRHQQKPYPLRITNELRTQLEIAAKATGRSLNAEIAWRLEASFDVPAVDQPDELKTAIRDLAGLQELAGLTFDLHRSQRLLDVAERTTLVARAQLDALRAGAASRSELRIAERALKFAQEQAHLLSQEVAATEEQIALAHDLRNAVGMKDRRDLQTKAQKTRAK